ncbi:hypothetical protein LCGC14_2404670, partial [marine sediment metagenome]
MDQQRCPVRPRCPLAAADIEDVEALARSAGRLVRRMLAGLARAGDDPPSPQKRTYLDRGDLARYAACPYQGWAVEAGLAAVCSPEAQAGREVHRVIAEALARYAADRTDPTEYMRTEILKARPDVQHEAASGLWRSARAIGRYLRARPPEHLLAFPGGAGRRSAELVREIEPDAAGPAGTCGRDTLDLLCAGA